MKAVLAVVVSMLLSLNAAKVHDEPLDKLAPAERDAWIEMGSRVHGGFGSLIARWDGIMKAPEPTIFIRTQSKS